MRSGETTSPICITGSDANEMWHSGTVAFSLASASEDVEGSSLLSIYTHLNKNKIHQRESAAAILDEQSPKVYVIYIRMLSFESDPLGFWLLESKNLPVNQRQRRPFWMGDQYIECLFI